MISFNHAHFQVEKKLLEPPKPKHEKSPPPKKLTSASNYADVAVAKTKKNRNALSNQNILAKSKSTTDVLEQKDSLAKPVNLLKTQRPPIEIHKIEGDKIIIIRRVPRAHRLVNKFDLKDRRISSMSSDSINQVTEFI